MKILLTSDTHYGMTDKTAGIHRKFLASVAAENPDLVVHAGDWASTSQNHLGNSLKMFRKMLGDVPMCGVLGNHDLWHAARFDPALERHVTRGLDSRFRVAAALMANKQVHRLSPDTPLALPGVLVVGFDGWYNAAYLETNDLHWMPSEGPGNTPTHEFLRRRAHAQFGELVEFLRSVRKRADGTKIILVTHHPIFVTVGRNPYNGNPRMGELLVEEQLCDILCMGHSHTRMDEVHGGTRLLNAGSDYEAPRFLTFEV